MAAIPVTITGMMAYTDLSVGGGPIFGGGQPGVPAHPIYLPPISGGIPTHPIYNPPGIWGGGNVPMPTPPIYMPPSGGGSQPGVPTHPIYNPPGFWGGSPIPWPTPPIYYPPPEQPEGPPTGDGKWAFVNPPGVWVWVPAEPGKPHPPIEPA